MKNLVFIEDYSSKYHLPEGDIVALNVRSHYELLKRGIDHYTISDLVDFESYLTHSEDYNNHQKLFFEYCDKNFNHIKINNRVTFSPFKIFGYYFKFIFDSIYTHSMIIYKIIIKFKPRKVILFSSYKPGNVQINYLESRKFRGYKFLFYEIIEYLSKLCNYNFESITTKENYSHKIKYFKERSKEKVIYSKYYNVYCQQLLYKNLNNEKIETYDDFKDTNNLFINQAWNMDKIIKYSLISNPNTIVLKNNYLFCYKGSKIKSCIPLHTNSRKSDVVFSYNYEMQTKYFDDFAHNTLEISLYELIYNRLKYINTHVVPVLLEECIIVEKMLREHNVEKVIGNMKSTAMQHIIAFIATFDSKYSYFQFTHGYNPCIKDVTFLELPCNYYITLNEELKNYYKESFESQTFYPMPKVDVIKL